MKWAIKWQDRREIDSVLTGQMVRLHRRYCRVSLAKLSRKMGISAGHLSRLETGRADWTKAVFDAAKKGLES